MCSHIKVIYYKTIINAPKIHEITRIKSVEKQNEINQHYKVMINQPDIDWSSQRKFFMKDF